MHPPVAASAVEQQPAEFPLQLGLRLQELHPEGLGLVTTEARPLHRSTWK
jgi:hypothetical protein